MTYRVRIEPSGHVMEVDADETVLEAAMRQGFRFPYSCRNGACGACKGRVLEGRVDCGDYQPSALTEEERREGKVLFCRAMPLSDLVIEVREIGAAKDIEVKTLPARVAKIEDLAPDVRAVHLRLPASERLQFLAGQYIDILLKDGARRGFSIANSPLSDELLELHIKRVPGGRFTEHVFGAMKEKDILRFEGPLGTFYLREESDRPVLMLATGTGFAPIKAMLEYAFAQGQQRPFHLYWGVRYERDFYRRELIALWESRYENFHFIPVVSRPSAEWQGRTGYVTGQVVKDFPDCAPFEAYLCGHPDMVHEGAHALRNAGLPEEHIFSDAFVFAKPKIA